MRPWILVTPDVGVRQTLGVDRRVYELNAAYVDAVERAGAIPHIVPYVEDLALLSELVSRADGVLLTGGDFDVDPRLYGEAPHARIGTIKPDRTRFEMELYRRARAAGLPVLGVCGGMQLINVVEGGTLWQDLPSQRESGVDHSQKHDRRRPAHRVALSEGSRVRGIYGQDVVAANTSHHQGIRTVGSRVRVTGTCEDGLPEVIELDGAFCVGVQWHPETLLPTDEDPRPDAIYGALVDAARERAR